MDWKSLKLPKGSRLFKQHNFTFMHKGGNYLIEVDEFQDGTFSGHGENSTDANFVIESVSGSSVENCVESIINKIDQRTQ